MKAGLNQILPVEIGIDLDSIEKVEFVFNQNGHNIYECFYPSMTAFKEDGQTENIIFVKFTSKVLSQFVADSKTPIYMDTRITLKDSDINPQTEITSFVLDRTLFIK